ncbi:hypothetical protein HU200_066664 [Digitaria exilis]|uniref:GDSL esterase/lipase n=1 Tax=Digitaria exilis TaxID=1010633 RepID=A0A835A0H7_9POAL|nr:hypothetical protein HU200_066664 [Digitaria exilis]
MANKMLRVLAAVLLLASAGTTATVSSLPVRRYGSIFSFGDSYTDTGNDIVFFNERNLTDPAAGPPYGMTFFRHPTGRNSNGRLIIDFIADALGLPFVPPFKTYNGSFRQGANFAVAGATALDASFFSFVPSMVQPYIFNASTNVQLEWFESLKPSLCSSPGKCKDFFYKSLFFMGEFGINDYSFSVFGKNLTQIRSFVPDVVKTISTAIEIVIKEGAKTVVVPGIPPMGCSPPNLAFFPSADPAGYDPRTGCLKQFNDLAIYHNSLLQEAIKNVQNKHRNAKVIYADFFTPIIDIIVSPQKLGQYVLLSCYMVWERYSKLLLRWRWQTQLQHQRRCTMQHIDGLIKESLLMTTGFTKDVLKCSFRGGGKYSFNMSASCAMTGATVCHDPLAYLFGTATSRRYVAKGWLNGISNCDAWPACMQLRIS